MTARSRIPSALEPYLRLPPEASQLLLTATLSCSVNWITCRLIASILGQVRTVQNHDHGAAADGGTAVVLVSWMRDLRFWKSEMRRTVSLDVSRLANTGCFTFVDFLNDVSPGDAHGIEGTERTISEAISRARTPGRKVVLILDNPDVLLAIASCTASQLNRLVLKLRDAVYSTAIVCSADLPMLGAATQAYDHNPTPIAVETSSFVIQQAHNASLVLSTRELETGAARDVSGLLRITSGGAAGNDSGENDAPEAFPTQESLYLVKTDGSAEVFRRGAVPAT